MKRILIFTVTAGNGHNTISRTLRDSLLQFYPGEVEVKIVNMYKDYPSKFRQWIIDDGYKLSVKYTLLIYNAVFKSGQVTKPAKHNPPFIDYCLSGKTKHMLRTIDEFKPDAIFCSHFLPAAALSELKEEGALDIPVATMETDFVYTPFLECCTHVDKIYLPAAEYVDHFIKVGYTHKQIEVLGYPSKILTDNTPRDPNKRLTLLIMSGAGAFFGLESQIRYLLKANLDIDIILINGRDERKKKHFSRVIKQMKKAGKLSRTNVENHGFVSDEKLLELLHRADCIVTKAGGNSTIETINLSKVLITTKYLAEQELSNVNYIRKYADCFMLDKPTALRDLVASGIFTQEFFENYIKNIRVLHRKNANGDYADALIKLCDINKK